jgi:hypothetical protein
MRQLTINQYVKGTWPAEYRTRTLSHTRLADVKKAAHLGKNCLNGGDERAAESYFNWVTDALYWRRNK